jgi:hypothetical protein
MRYAALAITTATAMIGAGWVSNSANAADLGPPPPEVISPSAVAPPRVDESLEPPQIAAPLEERCTLVWRCGYDSCGWRKVCAPPGAEGYPGPNGGYRPYGGNYRH